MKIYGIKVDSQSRCIHYHTKNDIVALMCQQCHKFYACYKCHDELNNHKFKPVKINQAKNILCGNCQTLLTYTQYKLNYCPYCQHRFNPKCIIHQSIYFKN
ncbi:CHY zinc finger protein [Apilactobacillus quenuiae]|uniref:CHY zinc finger protein n=1 Tax=Apilactobacillus quenuiae TaxID=2008377 RepID=UPI000D0173B9|nr:CHY zinc finger protein [Apilactobacillus quenuiae]